MKRRINMLEKKCLFSLLLALCFVLTLLPVTAGAAANTLEVGGVSYALTEADLNAAIAAAHDGDTIKFIASGTIPLTNDIVINKSITLDMNGQTVGLNSPSTFDFLSIPNGFSVTMKGSGTITTNTRIYVNSTATLTVQGGAVIEGTGDWQTLINFGNVSMTGGALRQTSGKFVLQHSGTAIFDNVTIETSNGSGPVIWAAGGTLTLQNCTVRNNFSGTMIGTLPSVILVSGSAAVTLDGGSVTAPVGSTLPAIEAASTTTFTNNGATGGFAVISVTTGSTTRYYNNHTAGWNAAAAADGAATVKLLTNWTAEGGSFGTGDGFGTGGNILVPSAKTITLDLSGKAIDRALTQSVENGNVITVVGSLTIRDSSSALVASQGTITGGYNSTGGNNSGGGILLSGTLNLEGGNIAGNKSAGWGGGVKNEGGTFTMTGGKISGNVTNYGCVAEGNFNSCGGGVYAGTPFIMTGGEISGNSVCGSGNFRKGGGVFFFGTVTVGGTAVIQNNKSGCTYSVPDGTSVGIVSGGITDNVYLRTGTTITCSTDTPIVSGASIGATTQTAPAGGTPVSITNAAGAGKTAYFHSDNSNYEVISTADTGLQLNTAAPGAPTIGTATAGDGQATVSFTAPASSGGADITSYTVTSDPGGITATGVGSPITVTGLTNGTSYTFTVTATNDIGTGAASAASNSVTPQAPPPSGGGGGGSYTPPAPVTKIENGGSTTGYNLGRLVSGGKTLTVDGDKGAKLVFDTEALKGIGGQTSSDIKVEMKDVSPAHQGNYPGKLVFSLTVSSGSNTISNFGGSVTVSLPYQLKEGETAKEVTVWYLASNGTMTEIPCTYDPVTKLATFTVTHFSLYVVGVDTPWVNPFTDVRESDWFYGAVKFANRNGLFAGTGADTFSPNNPMTRAMLWTVLGRLDGQRLSGSGVFDAARNWAMGAGITDGTNPNGSITREQLVTILWRYAGSPKADGELSKFSDSGSVAGYAADAMAWAAKNGIVTGANGDLTPQNNANRAQVATILQRFIENTAK